MKKLTFAACAALLAFVLGSCGHATAPVTSGPALPTVAGNGTQCYDEPIDEWQYNSCCDEQVHITGTVHFCYGSNGTHYLSHSNYSDLVVTGEKSGTLHGNAIANDNGSWSEQNDGAHYTSTMHVNLVGPSGCGYTMTGVSQWVVDANGNVRHERDEYSITCNNE